MPKQSARRRRRWRTRPSMAKVSILVGDIDFLQHRDSSWAQDESLETKDDPSFHMTAHVCEDEPEITIKKPIKKARKARPKPKRPPSIDESAVRKLNAIFEEVEDYSLIIEKVYEDKFVVPSESQQHSSNQSKAAGIVQQNNASSDSSSWSLDEKPKCSGASTKSPSPKKLAMNAMYHTSAPSTSHFWFENQPGTCQKSLENKKTAPEKTFSSLKSMAHTSPMSLRLSLSPAVADKEQSAAFSTPNNSGVETPKMESNENANGPFENLSLSFRRQDFLASTPLKNDEGKKVLNNSVFLNAQSPVVAVEESKGQQKTLCGGSVSRFSTADAFCSRNASFNRNLSQVTVDNPLNLFYYLRGFLGTPSDLNYLLYACGQSKVQSWEEFLPTKTCKKLGEGAYGEVFQSAISGVPVALKILPFMDKHCYHEGLVNGDRMKQSMEILPELLITKELSQLLNEVDEIGTLGYSTPGFVRLVGAAICQGTYPSFLLAEWDRFDKLKKSENDRPDTYSSPNQLFMVFALSLGGKDLEAYSIRNEREAFSIFFQVALSLAIAEETLEFEHRDLHIGNVLIAQCRATQTIKISFCFAHSLSGVGCGFLSHNLCYVIVANIKKQELRTAFVYLQTIATQDQRLVNRSIADFPKRIRECIEARGSTLNEILLFVFNNDVINMKSCGALVSIIDFTNSRMQKDGTTIFLDLSKDEELFKGSGDYQFDIYRMMREKNGDKWRDFTPVTNVLWLHYLATKLFGAKKIPLKRRKEIFSRLDSLMQHERIKSFLEEESVLEIFQDFVVS